MFCKAFFVLCFLFATSGEAGPIHRSLSALDEFLEASTASVGRLKAFWAATSTPIPPEVIDLYAMDTWLKIYIMLSILPVVWFYYRFTMEVFAILRQGRVALAMWWTRFFRGNGPEYVPLVTRESYKSNSTPFKGVWPACQVMVLVDEGTGLAVNGCGWRYADYIITARHVVENAKRVALSSHTGDVCEISLFGALFEDDLAIIPVSPNVLSRLAVSSARVDDSPDTFVRVVGPDNAETTIGVLRTTSIFGVVEYTGTTRPGYSGAPYIAGNRTVVAMHLSGGTANLAYSASYIMMRLAKLTEDREEEVEQEKRKKNTKRPNDKKRSSDWYGVELRDDTNVRVRRSKKDPDEFEVEIDGDYFSKDMDATRELLDKVRRNRSRVHIDASADFLMRKESKDFLCSEASGESSRCTELDVLKTEIESLKTTLQSLHGAVNSLFYISRNSTGNKSSKQKESPSGGTLHLEPSTSQRDPPQ